MLMPEEKESVQPFWWQALILALAVLLTWLWTGNPVLINYNLQLSALAVIVYFFCRLFGKKLNSGMLVDILVFTVILLLVISSTGGLGSSFFFLVYFLLFAVALLFDPPVTLTLTLSLTLFFANSLNSLHAALQLFSLLLFSGLALWFGKEYLRLLEAKARIKTLKKREKDLLREGKKIGESLAIEETDSLLWLNLNFKDGLLQIIHRTSELLADISRLSQFQKGHLQSIHETAKELLKSGERLKEKIDKETDL